MKIGVISDIHGNLAALGAVHAVLKAESPDLILNLGDCVSGPMWPEETAAYLRAEGWPTVRGNHDRDVSWPDQTLGTSDAWTKPLLSEASIEWLQNLPINWEMQDESVLACHGSPTVDTVFLLEEDDRDQFYLSSDARILEKLGLASEALILCGHSHTPRCVRLSTGQMIVNPGSVGVQAFPKFTLTGSPHARFAILTRVNDAWTCEHRAVDYDWAAAAKKAAEKSQEWAYCLETGFRPPQS